MSLEMTDRMMERIYHPSSELGTLLLKSPPKGFSIEKDLPSFQ